MSKKIYNKLLLLLLLIPILASLLSIFWWSDVTKAPSNDKTSVRFVVEDGDGASTIAAKLYKSGLIKSSLAFKFYVQLTGKANNIPAGEFEIQKNLPMLMVLEKLSGRPLELKVTIPEGLRKEEIAEIFINKLDMSASKASGFRLDFLKNAVEGYVYPQTYYFQPDVTGIQAVKRMKSLFDDQVTKGLSKEISKSELSLPEVITLASIVERETKTDSERPVVAGILLNRLRISMALQADATAQYAVANVRCKNKTSCDWWVSPTLDDLEINSPYNTYKFTGLPPYPISNPGQKSIDAVVNPTTTDYLFYIHDKDGNIHYAKTLAEHNSNISKYLGR
jgi:UPF0755 protein